MDPLVGQLMACLFLAVHDSWIEKTNKYMISSLQMLKSINFPAILNVFPADLYDSSSYSVCQSILVHKGIF
jgi:hypothetical protein